MLIGKKCEFKYGINIYTGIIVDKYFRDKTNYYIVKTDEKIEHIPCLCLTKIYTELDKINIEKDYIKTKIENGTHSHSF